MDKEQLKKDLLGMLPTVSRFPEEPGETDKDMELMINAVRVCLSGEMNFELHGEGIIKGLWMITTELYLRVREQQKRIAELERKLDENL